MVQVNLFWEDPEDREGVWQKGVRLAGIPRKDDTVIFDHGDADPPHDGYRSGVVVDVTWWGDGEPPMVSLKVEIADPPMFKENPAEKVAT